MPNSKNTDKAQQTSLSGEIFFITKESYHEEIGFRENSGSGSRPLARKATEVKEDWDIMIHQLNDIITSSEKGTTSSNYQVDEITVKLGFTAKGKLAFIAEAGVEASIEVKFKRK